MSADRATPIHPLDVTYREHHIKLTHRPKTNDWQYTIKHTRTITLREHAPMYATALKRAKRDIDLLLDGKR